MPADTPSDKPSAPTGPEALPGSTTATTSPPPLDDRKSVALLVLLAFAVTFIAARAIVILIMTRHFPTLYLHVGGTHVHHLNYGIFLLSGVGAYLLFRAPTGLALKLSGVVYGVALALTFDEFGMWVHLGGPYWQRASFDAVILIAAVLGLYCVAPALINFTRHHWIAAVLLGIALASFGVILADSMRFAGEKLSPIFQHIETSGPE